MTGTSVGKESFLRSLLPASNVMVNFVCQLDHKSYFRMCVCEDTTAGDRHGLAGCVSKWVSSQCGWVPSQRLMIAIEQKGRERRTLPPISSCLSADLRLWYFPALRLGLSLAFQVLRPSGLN